jgi:putative transposase
MIEFPGRPHHDIPGWVKSGARYHIRIRVAPEHSVPLTTPALASDILDAARRYHELERWWCDLFLLMPDHLHAIASFPSSARMSKTVQGWKRGTARFQQIRWQEGYFDHRIRDDDDGRKTWRYIRRNPVAKGLRANEDDWPHWWSPSTKPR